MYPSALLPEYPQLDTAWMHGSPFLIISWHSLQRARPDPRVKRNCMAIISLPDSLVLFGRHIFWAFDGVFDNVSIFEEHRPLESAALITDPEEEP